MTQQGRLFDPTPAQPPTRERFHVRKSAHATEQELERGRRRAGTQEAVIEAFFRARAGERFTPWEVAAATGIFIVSCRRAISGLTREGILSHHRGDRRPGPMGELSGTWGLAEQRA